MKPKTLWSMFGLVLVLAASAFLWLSNHALQLHHDQVRAGAVQILQQQVRVALWRLDSRLAPYVASLHQPPDSPVPVGADESFVEARFLITTRADPGGDGGDYRLVETSTPTDRTVSPDRRHRNQTLTQAVANLLAANGDGLFPRQQAVQKSPAPVALSKSQSYSDRSALSSSTARRKRQSRADVLQQQVAVANTLAQSTDRRPVPEHGDFQMLSLWVEDRLAVVRTPPQGGQGLVGVWIDWPALHRSLLADIDDLLPRATIRPLAEHETVDPEYALASLPAVIQPGPLPAPPSRWSPTHTALLLSWVVVLVSAGMAGVALWRLISLSQRRASFVSAVTHELRTPLTTFRLYSDLLAGDMVTDVGERKSYLRTLRREADRLTHLVDNVLRYSRLERSSGPPELEVIDVEQWIARIQPRLTDRLTEAGMELVIDLTGPGQWRTDPPAMEQVLFNLIDNAAKYAADAAAREVRLEVSVAGPWVNLAVIDHGPGIPAALQATMFQPFSKSAQRAAETAAGVGLGLALVRQTVRALGGQIKYLASPDGGAMFRLRMPRGV